MGYYVELQSTMQFHSAHDKHPTLLNPYWMLYMFQLFLLDLFIFHMRFNIFLVISLHKGPSKKSFNARPCMVKYDEGNRGRGKKKRM